jgi:predicted GH43/DUF377 family glycosyl hydrolase
MLVERFQNNPLITPDQVKPSRDDYEVICAFNPGVIKFNDQTILMLRVAERPKDKRPSEEIAPIYNPHTDKIEHLRIDRDSESLQVPDSRGFYYRDQTYLTSISHLRIARSRDGKNFTVDPEPAMSPKTPYETFGLEDPRITQIDDDFYIAYKAVSENAICTALAKTADFKNFHRMGIIFCPENLDVALFPEKINTLFYALHRPVPKYIGKPSIWLASSPDLVNWGNHTELLRRREGFFDSAKTGASCVPVKTDHGWLEIYHSSDEDDRYCLGAVLLDLANPAKIIARSKQPLMYPQADYEVKGFYGNVIFSCGCTCDKKGNIDIYYGAADQYTAAARTSLDKIMDLLK